MTLRASAAFIWAICVGFALAGCPAPNAPLPERTPTPTPPPFTCDMFMADLWPELRFGVDTQDDLVDRLVELRGIDRAKIGRDWDSPPWSRIRWEESFGSTPDSEQTAMFHAVENLFRISVDWRRWRTSKPTVAKVIDCLGVPDYYSAALIEDERDWLKFAFWYMERGLFVQGAFSLGQEDFQTIQPETPMGNNASHALWGDFTAVALTEDIEQMVSDVYGDSLLAWELCLIRPWPGSIEAIEILPYEEYLRCAT